MSILIETDLRRERARRALSQERMAELAGVTRQSYAAIESGASVPSTTVALRLARALGRPVEDLFRLADEGPETVVAEAAVDAGVDPTPVRIAEIAGRLVGIPTRAARTESFGPCDGLGRMISPKAMRVVLVADRPPRCELVAIGCDPSFGLVANALRRDAGVETVTMSGGSRAALAALARGHAHLAGIHLLDRETGEYNESWVRRLVPFPCTRIRFARWQQALVLGPGNPHRITGLDDLTRPGVRFLNREPGSGTRVLLDAHLESRGVPTGDIDGYHDRAASGHLAVAQAVASGLADAGVGIRAAGLAFGLDSIPVAEEQYDLVVPNHYLDLPAIRALLDLLRARALGRQVEALGGYDVAGMGHPVDAAR
jgi:molybdate-binding protein/DNA-binding XRE family transcriptional regulator